MKASDLVQIGNKLEVTFSIEAANADNYFMTYMSPEYVINSSAIFQMKTIYVTSIRRGFSNVYHHNLIFIKFHKVRRDDQCSYRLNFTSNHLQIADKVFMCDDGTWHLIYQSNSRQSSFDVKLVMDTSKEFSLVSLHSDTELTDFKLCGEDGSVQVHRALLAACSPMLRKMLSGDWREAAEGKVVVPGTSQKTLQQFKDYIYLQSQPNTNLEQILLLASYYMIPDLEQACVDKLVNGLTAGNICDLLEFALSHKMTKLLLAILECVRKGTVEVDDIRKQSIPSPISEKH